MKRAGTDVTVVATQMMVQRALQVAGDLDKEDISVASEKNIAFTLGGRQENARASRMGECG